MPQVITALIAGVRVVVAFLVLRIDDIANGREVIDFASRTKRDVIRLGLAQAPGQSELGFVGHGLLRKTQQRIFVHRVVNRSNVVVGNFLR